MSTREKLPTIVARAYRKKWPQLPTLALARLLYKENPELYTNVDMARLALRRIEGKQGPKSRARIDKSLFLTEDRPKNPYNLPPTDAKKILPYILPEDCSRILLLADIHFPYHDVAALTLALDYGRKNKVDTIILNGDILDCHHLSRFEKDPRKKSFKDEMDICRGFLKTLRKKFPKAAIIYKCGNHDLRYEKYLMQKAPELFGNAEFELKNLLGLKELDIDWVEDKTIIKLAALNILHGHEYRQGIMSPVNVARGLFMKAKTIAIQAHSHRTSENTVVTLNGDMITTWSIGCLCELQPSYDPYNEWNLGFAFIEREGEIFHVQNKRIKEGQIF